MVAKVLLWRELLTMWEAVCGGEERAYGKPLPLLLYFSDDPKTALKTKTYKKKKKMPPTTYACSIIHATIKQIFYYNSQINSKGGNNLVPSEN